MPHSLINYQFSLRYDEVLFPLMSNPKNEQKSLKLGGNSVWELFSVNICWEPSMLFELPKKAAFSPILIIPTQSHDSFIMEGNTANFIKHFEQFRQGNGRSTTLGNFA